MSPNLFLLLKVYTCVSTQSMVLAQATCMSMEELTMHAVPGVYTLRLLRLLWT